MPRIIDSSRNIKHVQHQEVQVGLGDIFKVHDRNHVLLGEVFEQRHHFEEGVINLFYVLLQKLERLFSVAL